MGISALVFRPQIERVSMSNSQLSLLDYVPPEGQEEHRPEPGPEPGAEPEIHIGEWVRILPFVDHAGRERGAIAKAKVIDIDVRNDRIIVELPGISTSYQCSVSRCECRGVDHADG